MKSVGIKTLVSPDRCSVRAIFRSVNTVAEHTRHEEHISCSFAHAFGVSTIFFLNYSRAKWGLDEYFKAPPMLRFKHREGIFGSICWGFFLSFSVEQWKRIDIIALNPATRAWKVRRHWEVWTRVILFVFLVLGCHWSRQELPKTKVCDLLRHTRATKANWTGKNGIVEFDARKREHREFCDIAVRQKGAVNNSKSFEARGACEIMWHSKHGQTCWRWLADSGLLSTCWRAEINGRTLAICRKSWMRPR